MKYLKVYVVLSLLLLMVTSVFAQEADAPLTFDQPASVNVENTGDVVRLAYRAEQASVVAFQALSDRAQPTIRILHDGEVVARQGNSRGEILVSVASYLQAGNYIIEIGTAQGSTGRIIVTVQTETTAIPNPVNVGLLESGNISFEAPIVIYQIDGLTEPAYLDIESDQGVGVRVVDNENDEVVAVFNADVLAGLLTLPASTKSYRVEFIQYGNFITPTDSSSFSLCYSPISASGCGDEVVVPSTPSETVSGLACRVTPTLAGGANIRQTASVDAPIAGTLAGGQFADVLASNSDGSWYQVSYNTVVGWASLAAVTPDGDCSNLPIQIPPPVPATATPIPPTPIPATATPSGPCLITLVGPEYVYTIPNPIVDHLLDQVQQGELIPVGRWNQNPNWWLTNYMGGWWFNTAGTNGRLSGDCSQIPYVNYP
jgi:hypothetical protein